MLEVMLASEDRGRQEGVATGVAAEAKTWEDFLDSPFKSLKDSDWRMDTAPAVMQSWHQSEPRGAPLKGVFLACFDRLDPWEDPGLSVVIMSWLACDHLGILSEDLEEGLVQKDVWVFLFRLLFCAN